MGEALSQLRREEKVGLRQEGSGGLRQLSVQRPRGEPATAHSSPPAASFPTGGPGGSSASPGGCLQWGRRSWRCLDVEGGVKVLTSQHKVRGWGAGTREAQKIKSLLYPLHQDPQVHSRHHLTRGFGNLRKCPGNGSIRWHIETPVTWGGAIHQSGRGRATPHSAVAGASPAPGPKEGGQDAYQSLMGKLS